MFQYWILQALGNLGRMDYAVASIKLCWGPMLTLGKGCFWELFSPEWTRFMQDGDKAPTRPSYCHPWANGVTHWLTHSLAGVVPLEPGFGRYAAMPHVSGRNREVSSSVPSPRGPVSVEARRDNQLGTVTVFVRAAVPGVVGLRLADEVTGCELDLSTATVDGAPAAAQTAAEAGVLHGGKVLPAVAARHAFVAVPAGGHTVTAAFSSACAHRLAESDAAAQRYEAAVASAGPAKGLPSAPPFPPAVYPGSWTVDATTGGAWAGKYGKDGYQLFAFDQKQSEDVSKLPAWVHSVSLFKGKSKYVGTDAANASFLLDPRGGGAASLGFATQGADGSQGTVIDVNVTAGTPYRLSLYMVGAIRPAGASTWSFSRQAIRVMDLATLDPIAPDPLIQDGKGAGVYWTLNYDRGVRLRVMPIDSDAGFSAVFFDKA
jgi:hypothetical protein